MSIYPPRVQSRSEAPANAGTLADANGRGKDATFVCGAYVGFSLAIDEASSQITGVRFQTNGCGHMIAAADVLCVTVNERHLGELHGLADSDLRQAIANELGAADDTRAHCIDTCISALQAAFADHRKRLINEFTGEKALVCTCFGVSEETIERHIESGSLETVDDVADVSKAGTGCGSCRMLIQEMFDRAHRESTFIPRQNI